MRSFRIFFAAIAVCLAAPFLSARADDSFADHRPLFSSVSTERVDLDDFMMAARILVKQGLLGQHVVDQYKRDLLFVKSGLLDQHMVDRKMAEQILGGLKLPVSPSAGLEVMSTEEGTHLAMGKSPGETEQHHKHLTTPAPVLPAAPRVSEAEQELEGLVEFLITGLPELVPARGVSEARELSSAVRCIRALEDAESAMARGVSKTPEIPAYCLCDQELPEAGELRWEPSEGAYVIVDPNSKFPDLDM